MTNFQFFWFLEGKNKKIFELHEKLSCTLTEYWQHITLKGWKFSYTHWNSQAKQFLKMHNCLVWEREQVTLWRSTGVAEFRWWLRIALLDEIYILNEWFAPWKYSYTFVTDDLRVSIILFNLWGEETRVKVRLWWVPSFYCNFSLPESLVGARCKYFCLQNRNIRLSSINTKTMLDYKLKRSGVVIRTFKERQFCKSSK